MNCESLIYNRKCSTADAGQAQVTQQQHMHLIEVTIDILNLYLKVYILKL
jgi:hypothetical protein